MNKAKLALALLLTVPSSLALALSETSQPAVQHVEVNFQPQNGEVDGASFQAMEGSFVFPISHRWAGQLDYMGGDADNPDRDFDIKGFTGHLFWRDPAKAMVDLSLSSVETGIIDYGQVKINVDYYWAKRTVSAAAGYQFGDIPHSVGGSLMLREYLSDTMTLGLDAHAADSQVIFGGGLFYQPRVRGLQFFGQAFSGNEGFDAYIVGLRLSFGGPAPGKQQRDRNLAIANTLMINLLTNKHSVDQAQFAALPPQQSSEQQSEGEGSQQDPAPQP